MSPKAQVLTQFPLPYLMGGAMLLFLFAFIVIVALAYRPKAKRGYDGMRNLPLED